MADSFYDAPRRGNRDWPDMKLADGVAPLNRVYQDTVTVSADLVRRFVKEERAVREVLVCEPVTGVVRLVLEGGFELVLDGTGAGVPGAAKTRVVDVSGCETGTAVAGVVAKAVAGWLPVFVGVAKGDLLGIYTSMGVGAVVSETVGWERRGVEMGIMRPGLPPDCLVGSYHPQCAYLMLVGVRLTSATDTHATFSRTWQVDLVRLGEEEAVDVEAMLRMGATRAQTLEKSLPPPRQFLPWVRTITETRKARVTEAAEVREELVGATVNEESLAAGTKTETRQEWGEPYVLVSSDLDPDTGTVRETRQEVVAAGTVATGMNATGGYQTVQQVDDLWAIRTSVQAAGLAGMAVKGVAARTYGYRDNYSWPRILDHLLIQPVLHDPGDAYSPVKTYAWRPVWLSEGYDGPCDYTVVERWTREKPMMGGDPNWTTDSPEGTVPDLPTETAMVRREIEFNGADMNVHVPLCLHSGMWIRDSQFFQQYPPSIPMRWPTTVMSRVTLTPDQGGWLTRMYLVNAPEMKGQGSGLMLTQGGETAGSFLLRWTGGTGEAVRLDVATDPSFQNGFLNGYRNRMVTDAVGREVTVTEGVRGMIYYARITQGALVSNTCVCAMKPVAELGVFQAGLPLAAEERVMMGQVPVGETGSVELTLQNVGLLPLRGLEVTVTGVQAELFSVGPVPTTMGPGGAVTLELGFEPVRSGSVTARLEMTSGEEDGDFWLELEGTGATGEILLEQPVGTEVDPEVPVGFGTVTEGSVSRDFRVRNVGNAKLKDLEVLLEGDDDFTVTDLGVTELEPEGWVDFTVTFEPQESEDAMAERTAMLRVLSDDEDENPLEVNLTSTYRSPTAAGALDVDYAPTVNGEVLTVAVQADGKAVIGGSFTEVNGVERRYCARLNVDGTVDAGFDLSCTGPVHALAVQADGKILLGGGFGGFLGSEQIYLGRVTAEGDFDSFYPALNGEVWAMAVQADGKILIGGSFTTVNILGKAYLARLHANGTVDTGFTTEVHGPVNGLCVLEDGKVLVVGEWGDAPGPVLGCMDPSALNFNPEATVDDGTCDYLAMPGCTDPTASNYDPAATYDDASCVYGPEEVFGCMDAGAENFNPLATVEDGSCTYPPEEVYGCTDPTASNYYSAATMDDGTCTYPPEEVWGCMDPTASNYDAAATVDDGSCEYPPEEVYGCTDPGASNYNSAATMDDGTCDYAPTEIYGCTDPSAMNFDPAANTEDGSCVYE